MNGIDCLKEVVGGDGRQLLAPAVEAGHAHQVVRADQEPVGLVDARGGRLLLGAHLLGRSAGDYGGETHLPPALVAAAPGLVAAPPRR